MSIEGYLTRELDIRFIDARSLVNEAKLALGMIGYPSKQELQGLREEALQIFDRRPETQKDALRRLKCDFTVIKEQSSALSSVAAASEREESSSSDDMSLPNTRKTQRGWLKRTFSLD